MGYSKAVRNLPIDVTITVPTATGDNAKLTFKCTRWTARKLNEITAVDTEIQARGEVVGPDVILDRVADQVVGVEGIDDFPQDDRPIRERFREYFTEDEEVVQEAYIQFQEIFFRFLPVELASRFSNNGSAIDLSRQESVEAGPEVRLQLVPERGEGSTEGVSEMSAN